MLIMLILTHAISIIFILISRIVISSIINISLFLKIGVQACV